MRMQLNRSTDIDEAMTSEAPDLSYHAAQLDPLDTIPRQGVAMWKVSNNISIQTGEEFSMKFLPEGAVSRTVTAVQNVAPNNAERFEIPHAQDRQMVYEELARVLGLKRMDSECSSDITEFASARGSTTQIDHAVQSSSENTYGMDSAANQYKSRKSTSEVCNRQASVVSTVSVLNESDSSKSLCSSELGVSDGSQSGKLKLLCSFGGKVLPRPSDGKLRYVGGVTRIISIRKHLSWEELMKKTAGICNQPHSIKYQLPGEDLDALISVSSEEDLQNMIDEYYGNEKPDGSQRLRIFLIPLIESETSSGIDASFTQQSGTDLQYVVAVNGMAGIDPNSKNCYKEQSSASEMGHLMPNSERNPRYERIDPFPLHPLEIKDSLGGDTQKWLSPPSSTPVPQDDMKNAKTTQHISNYSIGSIDGPTLFSILPLPTEDSIYYSASNNRNPQLDDITTKINGPINKHDVAQPNMMSHLILEGDNLAPYRVEQNNSNFAVCSQGGFAIMEKVLNLETPLPRSDHLVEILPGFSAPVNCYHGMPHAFSDSKLQEQGDKSAYASQEDVTRSFSLNMGRLQSSSHYSAAFPENPVQLHENVGCINTHLQNKALNVEPTAPIPGITLLHSPLSFEAMSEFEAEDISNTVGKCTLVEEDLRNQNSKSKPCDSDYISNLELTNNHEDSSHPFSGGQNLFISKPPVIYQELTNGLENFNFKLGPHIHLDSLKEESQVSSSLPPASSLVDMTESNDLELKLTQKNYFEKSSTGVTNDIPQSNSSWANSSEVAGLIHSSQERSHDNSYNSVFLNGFSTGLVSPQAVPSQSIEGPVDIGCEELKVRGYGHVDGPMGVGKASWSKVHHNSALFGGDVSVLDKLSHCTNNGVEKSAYVGVLNEHKKLDIGLAIYSHKEDKQKLVDYNLSPDKFPPPSGLDLLDIGDGKTLSPCAESESALQILDSGDVNADSHGDELFSDAVIAEMEADIYGLQIIKNADLEELRELGSGTFGTVYYGKWRGTDVAIKRIKKTCFSGRSSEQERLTKDFWREARILSNLHHPNVLAFYGVVPDGAGGTLATVTEFMANGSLRTALLKKNKLLDHRKKLIIAMDAAFGMEYLHSKNIVHFDLKCDNLLVNLRDLQRPICKVGDFGLSKIKRNTLVSGGVRGTLPWMAPELLNGNATRVSDKVDVFSFGIVLWEILTGEEPYSNMHCGEIIGGIVKNTLRPPIPERCDPEWRKLMEECWSANPEARPSFTEIAYRLRSMSAALQTKGATNLGRQLMPNISV